MRRHLSSYVKGFDGARELRTKLLQIEKFSELKAALSVY
jgi:tRNA-dihydrouridine synthase